MCGGGALGGGLCFWAILSHAVFPLSSLIIVCVRSYGCSVGVIRQFTL